MTAELLSVAASSLAGILATWVKLNTDMARMKARIDNLEKNSSKVSDALRELMDGVNEIKILLAKNRVE
jgi:prefoldin subunit 5